MFIAIFSMENFVDKISFDAVDLCTISNINTKESVISMLNDEDESKFLESSELYFNFLLILIFV